MQAPNHNEAILLVNMGGPDSLDQVRPFMRAIFRDPAILPVPAWLRWFVADRITARRTDAVMERYRQIGGKSPLHQWTRSLCKELNTQIRTNGDQRSVTYAFRYTSPTITEALQILQSQGMRNVCVLPLFPHHTSAMTGSVLLETSHAARGLGIIWRSIPAWGNHPRIIELWSEYLKRSVESAGETARVLFVAHGIPQRNVRRGETYPQQVQETAIALAAALPAGMEWTLAYQSKVGPIAWTQPYMEAELHRLAAASNEPIVIMPISFAADCLETLYDLDLVAMEIARRHNVQTVIRVRVFNDDPRFAAALASLLHEETHVTG